MVILDEKLKLIEQAILEQAAQKSQEIFDAMDAIKQEQIALSENAALSTAYEMIQDEVSDITTDSARELSQMRLKQKQEHLAKRAQYEKNVFDAVRTRLKEYTASPAYVQYLQHAAVRLTKEYQGRAVTLALCTDDRAHETVVRESFGAPCEIVFTDEIALGGIMLKDNNGGFVIDLTLDTRLLDQHDWFYHNCKL